MDADGRPAQPKAILRGHKAQVHAAAFVRHNDRLVTGDADGFVVAWDLSIMRPRAVWQAHDAAILGIAGWGDDRLITHGRDNKLIVWKLTADDERALSTRMPLDPSPETRPQPWLLHMLEVNTMNFCSFSHCPTSPGPGTSSPAEILIAVPNTLASEAIDIFHLPSQTRQHTVKLGDKNGMVMALALFHHPQSQALTLAAGYENGAATVAQFDDTTKLWTVRYHSQPHSQPILSLDVSPARDYFLTSSADAILAKHPLNFPPLPSTTTTTPTTTTTAAAAAAAAATAVQTTPLKTLNTKHAGQQSLRIRSDARLFATAGWDGRVRVYSARSLAEVAVLKWHTVGCYAAAFAEVDVSGKGDGDGEGQGGTTKAGDGGATTGGGRGRSEEGGGDGEKSQEVARVPKLVEVTVREKRERLARTAHWLAAGSKDGKVSLWDVF